MGFLTGNLTNGSIEGTRFADGNMIGIGARLQYDKVRFHNTIHYLDRVLEPLGISKVEAALRWLCYHSALRPTDGIIIGASNHTQLEQNIHFIDEGPLQQEAIAPTETVWQMLKR